MNKNDEPTDFKPTDLVDAPLQAHLDAIEREDTPERLVSLARQLQQMLRTSKG